MTALEDVLWPAASHVKVYLGHTLQPNVSDVSSECIESLRKVVVGLENHEKWAFKSKFFYFSLLIGH